MMDFDKNISAAKFFICLLFLVALVTIIMILFFSIEEALQFSVWLLFISCLLSGFFLFLLISQIEWLYNCIIELDKTNRDFSTSGKRYGQKTENIKFIVFTANVFFLFVIVSALSILLAKEVNLSQWLLFFSFDFLGIAALFSCLLMYSSELQWLRDAIKRRFYGRFYKPENAMEYRFKKLIKAEISEKQLKELLEKNEDDNLIETELKESLRDFLNEFFIKHKSIKDVLNETIKYRIVNFFKIDRSNDKQPHIDDLLNYIWKRLELDKDKQAPKAPSHDK